MVTYVRYQTSDASTFSTLQPSNAATSHVVPRISQENTSISGVIGTQSTLLRHMPPMDASSSHGGQLVGPNALNPGSLGPIGEPMSSHGRIGTGYTAQPQSRSSWMDVPFSPRYISDPNREMQALWNPMSGSEPGARVHTQRRPSNRDEFDGPHQYLEKPSAETIAAQDRDLPHLPTNLYVNEQDEILSQVNDRLSQCAFDFVARYQFPIPEEPDKRPVQIPADREWTEWVYLLKRLATKRRIPARLLYNGQIKQLVTVLENSLSVLSYTLFCFVSS